MRKSCYEEDLVKDGKHMLSINIPGWKKIELENLVLDFNGTLAVDGIIVPSIIPRLHELSKILKIFIISADTFGTVEEQCKGLPVRVHRIDPDNQKKQKGEFVRSLGGDVSCSAGNGEVDGDMLKESVLSVCVMGYEACSTGALMNSQLCVADGEQALDLLLKPGRIVATLRR